MSGAFALTALIMGLFALAVQLRAARGHIVLKLADGREIDVPEGTPIEEIERLLNLADGHDVAQIFLRKAI